MSKSQYLSFLIHKSELTDSEIAKKISKIGCDKFNSSAKNLSGHDVNKWLKGKYNIPRWAILSSFIIALDNNYFPENSNDWLDFSKTWIIIFEPDSFNAMLNQMEIKGIFKKNPTDDLLNNQYIKALFKQ